MTDAEAIKILVQHFLQDEERRFQEITDAVVRIKQTKPFDALGRAMFAMMTKTHMAQLQAAKATLTAKQQKRKPE
jgi:ribulose kinase